MSFGGISCIMNQLGAVTMGEVQPVLRQQRPKPVDLPTINAAFSDHKTNNRILQPLPHAAVSRKRAAFNRTMRSNVEWRRDLKEIYSDMFELANNKMKVTLHSYCKENENSNNSSQYKRIAYIWKELGLDECFSKGVLPTDPTLILKIDARFPLATENHTTREDEHLPPPARIRLAGNEIRSSAQWNDLLFKLYIFISSSKASGQKESVKSFCRKVLKAESQYRRIQSVRKTLELEKDIASDVSPFDVNLRAKIAKKYPKHPLPAQAATQVATEAASTERQRDLRPSSNSYFDEDEEAVLCECVSAFARAGFPLEKANLKEYADAILKADSLADSLGPTGISNDTVERIYKHGRLKGKTNVNPIDPKRAAQADPQVLNAFYHQLDAWIKIAHEIDPSTWPEDRYANVPPTRIYNTDEQGPNPTQLRNPVLIPEEMIAERSRLFQNTREGDGKMQFHYTVANIVRADGVQHHPDLCIEGAPAPYILISDVSSNHDLDTMAKTDRDRLLANQRETDRIQLNPAVLDGWFDDFKIGEKDDVVNKFGFQIRTTPTGSMLKRTFFDFILHFAKQLPHDQGENGLGVVLFLDWHCSRECPQSLITAFFKYNILIFVLPSKTSIWSQPCDNGKNELTAKAIAQAAHNLGLMAGSSLDYFDANRIFRAGLEQCCVEQNDELRSCGDNAVVSSFKKTGLYPMSYENEGWNKAFTNFNQLNELIKQKKRKAGEILPDVIWVVKARPMAEREELTEIEVDAIKGFLSTDDFLTEHGHDVMQEAGPQPTLDIPILFLAVAIADHLLGNYAVDPNKDITTPPTPTYAYEEAALKLVEYVAVSSNNRVDTTCTLTAEEIAQDKLRTKLALVKFGQQITLQKRASTSGRKLSLMKRTPSQFVVVDNKRRHSRNFVCMSVREILDSCFDANDDDPTALTAKHKRKGRKKALAARKKFNQSLYEEAKDLAGSSRVKRNIQLVTERLAAKRPRFAQRLEVLLEEEELDMEDLYQDIEQVVFEPYTAVVPVTRGDITKEISVAVVGSDTTAVGHMMEQVLMKLMLELNARNKDKAKRKRRRGAGQSTHLGKSGLSVGILIQRQNKEEELRGLEKQQKNVSDDLEKLKSLLEKSMELVLHMPDAFWKWDLVKGHRRNTLARLCGVFKSGAKADGIASSLRDLDLTKGIVEAKIQELKSMISEKEATIAPIIAEQRERQDFLDFTAEYVEDPNGDSDGEEE